jgi:hypothetical protein
MKIEDDKYKAQEAKDRERARQYKEKVAREQAQRKADQEAREKDLINRNNEATARLNSINQNDEAYNRIRQDDRNRRQEINNRFNQQMEAGNKSYNEYLNRLQEASSTNITASNDEFWNETIAPANFVVVRDAKTGLYAYENKQKKQVLPPKYDWARDIIKGVGLVREKPENFMKLINSRGETIRRFDKEYFAGISGNGREITGMSTPDTAADGLMVTRFYGKNIDNNQGYGCIDKEGNMVIEPIFYQIGRFKNGVSIAAKFLDEDKYSFKNDYPGTFSAQFVYVETGPINKQGKWLEQPKKQLRYSYGHYGAGMYLVVENANAPRLTEAEKKAQDAQIKLNKKKAYDVSFKQLEAEVQSRVANAQAQGYLIQNTL